jgi:multicomponent Na+:H+ antiporter subunit D
MSALAPLGLAVPLAVALLLALAGSHLPERVVDVGAAGAAVFGVVASSLLAVRATTHPVVYWFGGWRPVHGFPLGIAFVADRAGAELAALAWTLIAAALVFSWRYLEQRHQLYATTMLLWGAAMAGFALSGDLFTLVVFLELMSVAAYALTAYRIEDPTPVHGAFGFGVLNTLGSLLVLLGVALLYGRTGALNLAELGRRLAADGRVDGLVAVAFALLVCGFLVKAAIVPFHFWLADAYASAPVPICAVLGAVMSDLGLYAVARLYWTVFAGPLAPHAAAVRDVLVALGVATALVGALMAMVQRHLKRLLAFATISELGCFLCGIGLLSGDGLAGTAQWMVAHAFAKASLFLVCGVLLVRFGEVDELRLHGYGRRVPAAAAAWALAALALVGPPLLGTERGHALVDHAAEVAGVGWVRWVLAAATAVATGAILRAGARVFLGLGDAEDPLLSREPTEVPGPREHARPGLMVGVAASLAVAGLVIGAPAGVDRGARALGAAFADRASYVRLVFGGAGAHPRLPASPLDGSAVAWSLGILGATLAVAALGLLRSRLPQGAVAGWGRLLAPLRAAHSGHIGDYVAWLTVGVAVVGGLFALTLR